MGVLVENEILTDYLTATAARHSHLCPRQVLGVRIGLAGLAALKMDPAETGNRLLVILEIDGCFADAVQVVTRVTLGQHRLRVEDYGKVAATFVDLRSQMAVRVAPHPQARQRAQIFSPDEPRHYFAQLNAYQYMPDVDLLVVQRVVLQEPVERWLSRPGRRLICAACGEEIFNQREVVLGEQPYCKACAGSAYYRPGGPPY